MHWYDRTGRPAYEVAAKAGHMRPTTLRDARTLGLTPSVTTVLAVIDKPALNDWKVEQGILAALTLPRRAGEPEKVWLDRVRADSKKQAKDAAELGTKIHDAIEASFLGRNFPSEFDQHVKGVHDKLNELYPGVNDWVVEKSFAHPSGFGGKVDIHSPRERLAGDHKGKDGDFTDGKRLAYDQHWQLAAYQRGLGLPHVEAFNLFFSRTHPGRVAYHIWPAEQMQAGWRVFEAALQLWVAMKGFDPSFNASDSGTHCSTGGIDMPLTPF